MLLPWHLTLMSLHNISDALVALIYFFISTSILYIVVARDGLDRTHLRLGLTSASLLTSCGLLIAISIINIWAAIHNKAGLLTAFTAVLSLLTAGGLIMLLPRIIELRLLKKTQLEMIAHRESAVLLRTVIELVPGLICAKDGDGRMLFANQALLDAVGRQWAEVDGKQDIEFLHDAHQAELIMRNDRQIMDSGRTQELEEIVDHPQRGPYIYQSTKVPLSVIDERMTGLVIFAVDITEREQNTQELLHTARRTAMGDVAAAIAHELNQPLAAVSLYLGGSMLLLDQAEYAGPITEALSLANEQCLRAGEIIRQVRSFVSGDDDVKRPESVQRLVDEACALALLGMRDKGIATAVEHGSTDIEAFVHKVQIEQVIVNLIRNAIDAMGNAEGGTLHITTGLHDSGIIVSVKDNGPGISPEVFDRLFEPFVSTKGVKGMGVGLSICRTIIENHGGKIWADSYAGTGTTFHFTLPVLAELPAYTD